MENKMKDKDNGADIINLVNYRQSRDMIEHCFDEESTEEERLIQYLEYLVMDKQDQLCRLQSHLISENIMPTDEIHRLQSYKKEVMLEDIIVYQHRELENERWNYQDLLKEKSVDEED